MLKRNEKELRTQVEAVRRDLRDLERRIGQITKSTAKPVASKRAPAKKVAAKKKTTAKKAMPRKGAKTSSRRTGTAKRPTTA